MSCDIVVSSVVNFLWRLWLKIIVWRIYWCTACLMARKFQERCWYCFSILVTLTKIGAFSPTRIPLPRPFGHSAFRWFATKRCYVHRTFLVKVAKIQRSYVPLCGHMIFALLTPARTMTISDRIKIFCNYVNKTSTFVEYLAINILHYMSQRSNVGLWIKSTAGLKTFVEEWTGHNTFVHPLGFDELIQ